jgi:hypothetical protein
MNPILAALVIAFCWVAAQVIALVAFRVLGHFNSRRR